MPPFHDVKDISTGDIFLAGEEPLSEKNHFGDLEPEVSEPPCEMLRSVLSRHFQYHCGQIFIHLLPLTARDAFSLKGVEIRSEETFGIKNGKRENNNLQTFLPFAASIALQRAALFTDVIRALHRFLRDDFSTSQTRIRFTRTDISPSNSPRYSVNPFFLTSRNTSSPLQYPPPPIGHPVDMSSRNIIGALTDKALSKQCKSSDPDELDCAEALDAKWLISPRETIPCPRPLSNGLATTMSTLILLRDISGQT